MKSSKGIKSLIEYREVSKIVGEPVVNVRKLKVTRPVRI